MSRNDETPHDLFMRTLEIDRDAADALVTEGFTTLEEVAYVPLDELMAIEAVDESQAHTWRLRAIQYVLGQMRGDGHGDQRTSDSNHPLKPLADGAGATIDDE